MDLMDRRIEEKSFECDTFYQLEELTEEENKCLEIMIFHLLILELDFELAKTRLPDHSCSFIVVLNGEFLLDALGNGFEITRSNPIQENIKNLVNHYNETLKYVSDAYEFSRCFNNDNFLAAFSSFNDASELIDGYIEKDKTYLHKI